MGILHGIKIARSSPLIFHLLFAYDVLIFSKANIVEASGILHCLSNYSLWSGQCINVSRFAVFFSRNCKDSIKSSINDILRLPPILVGAKYLGLPLFLDRKKADSFIELKEWIFAKVTGWKTRLLSQAAITTLIKSVANVIPSYIMSLFLLPKNFCHDINSMLRKFWWGFPQDKKHRASLANNYHSPSISFHFFQKYQIKNILTFLHFLYHINNFLLLFK
jgi:hypothetical protein